LSITVSEYPCRFALIFIALRKRFLRERTHEIENTIARRGTSKTKGIAYEK